ncbi:beta-lactamase-like protein [Xylariomycetidae sp. FL0641]|nr:beta-lactamase-like protein [Xylariomycetidae sp. FL0641]
MASNEPPYDPKRTGSWLVCTACGTQFPTVERSEVKTCFICDDPRQFTPPSGQSFTTLDALRSSHRNTFHPLSDDDRFISVVTEPKVAIGQRAVIIKTPKGNVMWDCITLLDDDTIKIINAMGGLKAIVISHPHYYTTHVEWGRAFNCPVYVAEEDKVWLAQKSAHQSFITETETDIQLGGNASGVKALKLGGHFPGSLVALYEKRLFIADTLVTTPAGMGSWKTDAEGNARDRPKGMNSYSFLWSIPNMIPLAPDELERMWSILKRHEFTSTHGAFLKMDINQDEQEMKRRVLESMQIQIKYMGHGSHAMLKETVN